MTNLRKMSRAVTRVRHRPTAVFPFRTRRRHVSVGMFAIGGTVSSRPRHRIRETLPSGVESVIGS
ncbi:hypothetical protein ASG56_15990 [Rhodococcus sp. Leaf7]|nr:hypothetical protein RU01_01600 [Rhodococcus sp. MEB064]KQU02472.1 hypothetical protein ASG56_15990 [Rhodococcus sp. Leaf7]KQU37943.1 hypothetical protein ASG64_18720 [Rhodococcus sp. Leaf247]